MALEGDTVTVLQAYRWAGMSLHLYTTDRARNRLLVVSAGSIQQLAKFELIQALFRL